MTPFIIFNCLFIISLGLLFSCFFADWNDWVFVALCILIIVSGLGMIFSAALVKPDIKAIEYPASEYTFKIKVVELEEQKDTILVVIPKEK